MVGALSQPATAFVVTCALVLWAIWALLSSAPPPRLATVAVLFLLAAACAAVAAGRGREHFAPAFRVCADGGTAPDCPQELPDSMDEGTLATMPLKPCAMYFVPNTADCDEGWYEKTKLELLDIRAEYEKAPAANAPQLEQMNRIIANYDTVFRRQCKLTFNNWVRPDDPSYPLFHVTPQELQARGNPRHWAFCFAPTPTAGARTALEEALADNARANGATVLATPGDNYRLSNNVDNTRVEFSTMGKDALVKTFCKLFNPLLDPALAPFYQNFAQAGAFFAIDLTNDGILRGIRQFDWNNGNPQRSADTERVVWSAQDDLSRRPAFGAMPQTPERFVLESSYHCAAPPLYVRHPSAYTLAVQDLFAEEVVGGALVFKLKQSASLYVFNINTCDKVDRITPKSIANLPAFLGNVPSSTTLRAGMPYLSVELWHQKNAAHTEACAMAAAATDTFNKLKAVRARQVALANEYVAFSQPGTGERVRMQPKTTSSRPAFTALRDEEQALQRLFEKQVATKSAAQAKIAELNLQLTDIDANKRRAAQVLQQAVVGKKIAVKEKPYTYISNDGNVYFHVAA